MSDGVERRWESNERILIKRIPYYNGLDGNDDIVVVGVAAEGIKYEREVISLLVLHETYVDVGDKLRNEVINGIAEKIFFEASNVSFLDPSPWMEKIELPGLAQEFSIIGMKMIQGKGMQDHQ